MDENTPNVPEKIPDVKTLRFLGRMQEFVPHRTVLSCPQSGAFALFCVCGPGLLNEGRNTWPLPAEAVVLVRAGQTPVLRVLEHPLRVLSVLVETDLPSSNRENLAVFTPWRNGREPPSVLFSALLERFAAENEDALLHEFLAKLEAGIRPLQPCDTQGAGSIRQLKTILDTRYTEKLTLDLLADELHWNKYKLEKDFKKYFHCTPFEYLLNIRVEASCRLLLESGRKVNEIGFAVGVENTSYFIRMFKRRTGMSPVKYRTLKASGVSLSGLTPSVML